MRTTDTLALLPRPAHLFVPKVATWWWAPVAVGPLVAIAANGSSIAVAHWSDTEPGIAHVQLRAPDGSVRWRRRLVLNSARIPSAVRDSLIAVGVAKVRPQLESARRQGKAPPGSAESLVERGLSLPRNYPPICGLVVGVDGTVWIEQAIGLTGGTWIVLDRVGNLLFNVRVPAGFTLEQATQQSLWGTEVDDLGVSYLMRLRIVG